MRSEPDYGVRPCCLPTCDRTIPRNRALDVCRQCGTEIALAHLADATLRDELSIRQRQDAAAREAQRLGDLAKKARVYYVRLDDERIKIGYTSNLRKRLAELRVSPSALLACEPGGREREAQVHQQFATDRINRREEFHPSVTLTNWIAFTREAYGLPRWATLPDTRTVVRR